MARSLKTVDKKIALFYGKQLFKAARRGESAVYVWFPGAGKSVIVRDVVRTKSVLASALGQLTNRTLVVYITLGLGDLNSQLVHVFGVDTSKPSLLNRSILETIDKGKEVLIVVDNLENMSTKENTATLKAVGQIVAINSRRIHSIINTFDPDEVISITHSNPQCFNLINTIDYLPIIDGPLLTEFIRQRADELERVLSIKEIANIEEETGGLLFLTKELIRGNQDLLNIKIQALWNRLNDASKHALMCYLTNSKLSSKEQKIIEQFRKHNILKLHVFTNRLNLLVSNPGKSFSASLSKSEHQLVRLLSKNYGLITPKESIAQAMWKNNWEDNYSNWAIDAAISRIRKKLVKAGIDSSLLKTIKGRGYKWLVKF